MSPTQHTLINSGVTQKTNAHAYRWCHVSKTRYNQVGARPKIRHAKDSYSDLRQKATNTYTVRVIIKFPPNTRTHGYGYERPTNARTGFHRCKNERPRQKVRASDRTNTATTIRTVWYWLSALAKRASFGYGRTDVNWYGHPRATQTGVWWVRAQAYCMNGNGVRTGIQQKLYYDTYRICMTLKYYKIPLPWKPSF